MWSIAENMNSGLWSDWILEGVDTSGHPNLTEESFIPHVPRTGPNPASAALDDTDYLLHVLKFHVHVKLKHEGELPGLPQPSQHENLDILKESLLNIEKN